MRDHLPAIPRISVSVDEARQIVLEGLPAPRIEQRAIHTSLGLVLAEPVYANLNAPAFDTSAMDGFAVCSADLIAADPRHPVSLEIKGTLFAGQDHKAVARRGTTYGIMTGCRMPRNADAVLAQELAHVDGDRLILRHSLDSGTNVRQAQSEITRGDLLLSPGCGFEGIQLALLDAQQVDSARFYERPNVEVIATGDEISTMQARDATIRDANLSTLITYATRWGARESSGRVVPDSVAGLNRAILEAKERGIDLIVTSGGASGGDRDVVTDLIRNGAELTAYDVRMKPGRPLIVGTIDRTPLIGLPGNPVAALVSAMQFVRPAIHRLSGHPTELRPLVVARLTTDVPNPGQRTNFLRVALESGSDGLLARPFPRQTAADLATLARADGLLVIPEDCTLAQAGDRFEVQLLRSL